VSDDRGMAEALKRIEACRISRADVLDLGGLQLERVPEELLELTWLKRLYLGASEELRAGRGLWFIDGSTDESCNAYRALPDAFSRALAQLEVLDLSYAPLSSLDPLAGLSALTSLDCSFTQVSSLDPLSGLIALTSLTCSRTQVSSLEPLSGLIALTSLNCAWTGVPSLEPLSGLIALTSLTCSRTQVSSLEPVSGLNTLTSLDCSHTQVSSLEPVSGLNTLTSLDCSHTQVSNLEPLSGLIALTSLNCAWTGVPSLEPLAFLIALTSLDCWRTKVSSLEPLSGLNTLTSLNCAWTQVSNLEPLKGLTTLASLDCWHTQVSSLEPLSGLNALTSLDCSFTQVSSLEPLKGLTALASLGCWNTQVSSLEPLAGLGALTSLTCSWTPVSSLEPLAGLTALVSLDCSFTQVSSLDPLAALGALTSLNCSGCALTDVPSAFWEKPCLRKAILFKTRVPGIPDEVLSKDPYSDNCLPALRAHLADLGESPERLTDVKLMVLGNGRIGKTQIVRRLQGKDYQANSVSTHGVIVSGLSLDIDSDPKPVTANIWDFGGQDIYHATHALFFRTRAIFLVCWHPDQENEEVVDQDGFLSRNQRLPYWLNHILQFAGERAPVIVAQTQCDTTADECDLPEDAAETLKKFEGFKRGDLKTSSAKGHGFPSLLDLLRRAYVDFNPPLIGPGRAKVKRDLEERRARLERLRADAKGELSEADRKLQTLSLEEFESICSAAGQISDTKLFLKFLHNAGTVFYQADLLGDQIIIDQNWALEAIYAVFNRETCVAYLRSPSLEGRFSRATLGFLLWDKTFTTEEQHLFLSMMESCGICFRYIDRSSGRNPDREQITYVAPEFLPDKPKRQVLANWPEITKDGDGTENKDARDDECRAVFASDLTSLTLIRGIISDIGREAGPAGEYWANGLQVFDENSGCLGLIQQTINKQPPKDGEIDGGSVIVVRARAAGPLRGNPAQLVEQLSKVVQRQADRFGIKVTQQDGPSLETRDSDEKKESEMDPRFTAPPSDGVKHYVSYAWADDRSEAGRTREEKVDLTCDAYAGEGVRIFRDKTELRTGDDIWKFMQDLGASDRVFVFLSDKYLKSPFCMYELFELWRNARMDQDAFSQRVRIFTLDDADIWSLKGRLKYVAYWEKQLEEHSELFEQARHLNLSAKSHQELRNMQDFAQRVDEILVAYTTRIQPRTFEEFLEYRFDDEPDPGDGSD
jgi:internalin A